MKLPKLWRKKNAAGKFVGSYHVKVAGVDVNLGTSDANEATRRRLEAVRNRRRNFVDEIDEAADATETAESAPPPAPAAAAAADAPAAPAAPAQPDGYIPPPQPQLALPAAGADAHAEAEATNDAAAEDGDADDQAEGGAPQIPPDVLDQFLRQGALVLVDLQLELQAAGIRKWRKKQPLPIPESSPVRQLAAEAWCAQLKVWFPADMMLAPWALALILPALCIPVQLATAVDLPKEDQKPEAASADAPAEAAA